MIDRKLLDKFYAGQCTPEEVQKVLSWFETQNEGEQRIEKYWHLFASNEPLRQKPGTHKPTANPTLSLWHNQWIRVAAVLALAFSLAVIVGKYNIRTPVAQQLTVRMMVKETLAGQKLTFQLPDSSLVILNTKSRLTYPESFDGKTRDVNLVGEAFFEVAENPSQPFIVSARGVDTQALGTSFNIRAYEDEPTIEVVLATGKVKVDFAKNQAQPAYLIPGEKIIADEHKQSLHKSDAELAYALAWKDNIIHFHKATAGEVFAELERWYDVEIAYLKPDKTREWHFTGKFKNESLENVLTGIGYAKNFEFKIEKRKVSIVH